MIRANRGLSVPDPDVRGIVVGEIKRVVMPLYSRFYDKYLSSSIRLIPDIRTRISQKIPQNIFTGIKTNSILSSLVSSKEVPQHDLKFRPNFNHNILNGVLDIYNSIEN